MRTRDLGQNVSGETSASRHLLFTTNGVGLKSDDFSRIEHVGRQLRHLLGLRYLQTAFALPGAHRVVIAAAFSAFTLSGCGMSSLTSGLGSSVFGPSPSAKSDVQTVSEDQLLSAAKAGDGTAPDAIGAEAGGCPRFVVGQRDNTLTIYETGRVGDGLAIIHRGEITKTGRECQIDQSKVTVKYGFAGRVLLGPKGKGGSIKLPVTITVTDAKRAKIASDSIKVDVDIAVDKPIGYFSAVKSITIPIPEGSRAGEFEVLVGFDRAVPGAG